MSRFQRITFWVITAVVVGLIAYDTFAAAVWGTDATESVVMLQLGHAHPIIPFALGVLIGHFFWSQRAEAKQP